jgi:hypothetical protein
MRDHFQFILPWVLLGLMQLGCGSETHRLPSEDASGSRQEDTMAVEDDVSGVDQERVEAIPSPCSDDQLTLTFAVDDRANKTYSVGKLIWTGSFSYDGADNTLTYAVAWNPEDGPYPLLYDDGPISEGGHEAEGAEANDHIFSVAVCYVAEDDRLLAYGLLNDDLRWIWTGPNGTIQIDAGATGRIDLPMMTIGAHGDLDMRLYLDLNEGGLHPDYATIGLETHRVYVKGTMNSWTPLQLLDDGQQGDALADDGVLTYQHSQFLGAHDGLLNPGQEAQFIFVFAMGEGEPDAGLEYKIEGDAVIEGVSAEVQCDDGWASAEVTLAMDSKGLNLNTAIQACGEEQGEDSCDDEHPCANPSAFCVDGECVVPQDDACDDDSPCQEPNTTCVDGECVEDAGVECDDDTPCTGLGETCVDNACVADPAVECDETHPCMGAGEICKDGACTKPSDAPELFLIVPQTGSMNGGTHVSLHGKDFLDGVTVHFGDSQGSISTLESSLITLITPAHALGAVDVMVTNPEGGVSIYPQGFTYVETANAPQITGISPEMGSTSGGTLVTLEGQNFEAGATIVFGTFAATNVDVATGGASLTAHTPSAPIGVVDVTLQNPDGQEAVLLDGFSFVAELPDWGQLLGDDSELHVLVGQAALLSGQVYEPQFTPGDGAATGMMAQLGFGDFPSDPQTSEWMWTEAIYSHDEGNDDVYSGGLTPPLGIWSATFRFSMSGGETWLYVDRSGADDGFQPDDVLTLHVTEPPTVQVSSLSPETVWPLGGTLVTLTGQGFHHDCTLTIDGVDEASLTLTDNETLTFIAPAHAPGEAPLQLICPQGTVDTEISYESWDGVVESWPNSTLSSKNTTQTNWGDANYLDGLYLAADATLLYVGVTGGAVGSEFGKNSIVVYVDTDYGQGTGLTDTATLTDVDGDVDDTLGGLVSFDVDGFGAELGFASLGMASYTPNTDIPSEASAGWRSFADLGDLPWLLEHPVAASSSGIEAVISLEALYGLADGGTHELAFIVRLVNHDGSEASNQSIPNETSGLQGEITTEATPFTLTY